MLVLRCSYFHLLNRSHILFLFPSVSRPELSLSCVRHQLYKFNMSVRARLCVWMRTMTVGFSPVSFGNLLCLYAAIILFVKNSATFCIRSECYTSMQIGSFYFSHNEKSMIYATMIPLNWILTWWRIIAFQVETHGWNARDNKENATSHISLRSEAMLFISFFFAFSSVRVCVRACMCVCGP